MSQPPVSDNDPATDILPQFESAIYQMFADEVDGLTDEQLDFESHRWEWSKWSIRRNVSHVATGDYRWLLRTWGRQLFPEGFPDLGDLDLAASSRYDSRLAGEGAMSMDAVLETLRQSLATCQAVLCRETAGSLRSKEIRIENSGNWPIFSEAHPGGLRPDPDDPSYLYMSLEATLRHRYFEHITHLYNIQRLKRAQGLATRVKIPREGYWALPGWDRSEP